MKLLATLSSALLVIALVSAFIGWPGSVASFAEADSQAWVNLLQHWAAGKVVVLVRHAERCDRSDNPCLGPVNGITRVGSEAAVAVGRGLQNLGMQQTDVLSSHTTRTTQTAYYMFGQEPQIHKWLSECGSTLLDDVIAHKRAGRNLVLVTHDGCISDFAVQSGLNDEVISGYATALFVHISSNGQFEVLGTLNAEEWNLLSVGNR